jgi:hypothetical protein
MRRWRILAVAILAVGCGSRGRELSPIRLVSMIKLGADSGDGAIATTPVVSARHPGGFRVVVAQSSTIATPPLVFSDDGRFLGTLGGESDRTGTFSRPMFTRIGPGDSLWVFDNARGVLVFSPSRLYVRTIVLTTTHPDVMPALADAVVLPDGRIAAITSAPVAAQLFNALGVVERDIGARDTSESQSRHSGGIALAPDGTLWTTTRYGPWRLKHWDAAGRLLGVVEPAANWLVDSIAARRSWYPKPDQAPPPVIRAIWFDAAGRLWVLGEVADRHWKEGFIPVDSTEPAGKYHIEADKYLDTIVEVRDPTTGRLIAAARFDIDCGSIAEPGVLVHEADTHAGWRRAELLRVVFDENAVRKAK